MCYVLEASLVVSGKRLCVDRKVCRIFRQNGAISSSGNIYFSKMGHARTPRDFPDSPPFSNVVPLLAKDVI